MTEAFVPHTAEQCVENGYAHYNPHDRDLWNLPFIFGFNNGGQPGLLHAVLIAEDGTGLGSHICSHEGWMPHDLGIIQGTRPDRHEDFQRHYPNGYVMDFVSHGDVRQHPKLVKAFELNDAIREAAEKTET